MMTQTQVVLYWPIILPKQYLTIGIKHGPAEDLPILTLHGLPIILTSKAAVLFDFNRRCGIQTDLS